MGIYKTIKGFLGRNSKASEVRVHDRPSASPVFPEANYNNHIKHAYELNEIVYAAVTKVANGFSESEITVIGKDKKPVDTHPLIDLLQNPNSYQTTFEFFEQLLIHYYFAGNVYIWKKKAAIGVTELKLLRPDRIQPIPDPFNLVSGYQYRIGSTTTILPADEVVHIRAGSGDHDILGMPPIQAVFSRVLTDNEATRFTSALLNNCGIPGALLVVKNDLSDTAFNRFKTQWKQAFGGKNRGNLALIEADAEYKQLAFNMHDMAFPEITSISSDRILAIFGIPPILMGYKDPTYSNYAQARRAFTDDAISPLQRRIAQAFSKDPDFVDREEQLFFDNYNVPANAELRQQKFDNATKGFALGNGFMTINDARLEAGLTLLDDKELEEMKPEPVQIEPVSPENEDILGENEKSCGCGEVHTKLQDTSQLDQILPRLSIADRFYKDFERWAKKEFKKWGKQFVTLFDAETKALDPMQLSSLENKVNDLEDIWKLSAEESISPLMDEILIESSELISAELGVALNVGDDVLLMALSDHKNRFAKGVSRTMADSVRGILKEGFEQGSTIPEIKAALKNRFIGDAAFKTATGIAQTETVRAVNTAAMITYRQNGIEEMEWSAAGDSCPYCASLHGKIVGTNSSFVDLGDSVEPHPDLASTVNNRVFTASYNQIEVPPLHRNCRCAVLPVTR